MTLGPAAKPCPACDGRGCPACDGRGWVYIAPVHQETLKYFQAVGRVITTRELAEHFGINITTALNRLVELRRLGLITRHGSRKSYTWEAKR